MRPAHLNHLLISLWRWDTFFRPIKSFHHVQHQRHNRTWWWCWHSKNLVICRKYIAYVVQAVYISHGQNVTADFLNFFRILKVVMHKCSAGWSLFLFKINNDNIVLKMTLLSRIITTALKIIVFSWIIAFYLSYAIFPLQISSKLLTEAIFLRKLHNYLPRISSEVSTYAFSFTSKLHSFPRNFNVYTLINLLVADSDTPFSTAVHVHPRLKQLHTNKNGKSSVNLNSKQESTTVFFFFFQTVP